MSLKASNKEYRVNKQNESLCGDNRVIKEETQAKPINGFMLAAGYTPTPTIANPNKGTAIKVKSYGKKSDRIIDYVADKAVTIEDISIYFDWEKTSTGSLVNKIRKVHKALKVDLEFVNGVFINIVRGLNFNEVYTPKYIKTRKPIICGCTDNTDRQKVIIKLVELGFKTTTTAIKKIDIDIAYLRRYFKRLFLEGYLSRFKIKNGGAYSYSVTEKGLEFIGGNHE